MIKKIIPQQTLAKPVNLQGVGLHSGKQIELILNPAPENSGIKFIRTDLDPVVEIPALANFVSKTDRSTLLLKENVEIQTTEHLLAAIWSVNIGRRI